MHEERWGLGARGGKEGRVTTLNAWRAARALTRWLRSCEIPAWRQKRATRPILARAYSSCRFIELTRVTMLEVK